MLKEYLDKLKDINVEVITSQKLEEVFLSYSFGVNMPSTGSCVLASIIIFALNPRATKFLVINFTLDSFLECFCFLLYLHLLPLQLQLFFFPLLECIIIWTMLLLRFILFIVAATTV